MVSIKYLLTFFSDLTKQAKGQVPLIFRGIVGQDLKEEMSPSFFNIEFDVVDQPAPVEPPATVEEAPDSLLAHLLALLILSPSFFNIEEVVTVLEYIKEIASSYSVLLNLFIFVKLTDADKLRENFYILSFLGRISRRPCCHPVLLFFWK